MVHRHIQHKVESLFITCSVFDYCMITQLHCRTKYCRHVEFATSLNIKWRHNHPLMSADVLRRRDVSSDVADKFEVLFSAGHSPSSTLEMHKCDLQMADDGNYTLKAADRYYCPDLQWCYRLYHKLFRAEYGTQSGPGMVDMLMKRMETRNSTQ